MKVLQTHTILLEGNRTTKDATKQAERAAGIQQTNEVNLKDMNEFGYNKNTNWDVAYSKINKYSNFDAYENFWNAYFSLEWGKDKDRIEDLGETFIIEVEEFGFSEASNPFIKFLKSWAENNDWPKNLNGQSYKAIHNAFVRNYLDSDDLTKDGRAYTSANIIYCPALYDLNARDILVLLQKQNYINSHFKSGMQEFLQQTSSNKIRKIYGKKDTTVPLGSKTNVIKVDEAKKNTFLINVFSSDYNPQNIEETICDKNPLGDGRNKVWVNIKKLNSPAIVENILKLTLKVKAKDQDKDKVLLSDASELSSYIHKFVSAFGSDSKNAFAKFLVLRLNLDTSVFDADTIKDLDKTILSTKQIKEFRNSSFITNFKFNSKIGYAIVDLLTKS